ncbi:MAG: GGDEF domain-containing protein [Mesorhizobium sp.]|nr:GGDEF domain-containing protein [Mesorhizobium sp.]
MGPNATLLLAAIAIVLVVMAAAFYLAGRRESRESYWRSWCLANLLIAGAIVVFIFARHVPPLLIATLPNALLVLGFAMRWQAARQFAGRAVPAAVVLGLGFAFAVLCTGILLAGTPGDLFNASNVMLGGLAGITAYEFWRDRADQLPSRYALIAIYAVVALSFLFRAVQLTFFDGLRFEEGLPRQMLEVHLLISILHVAGSGAFALSLAYERGAARLRYAATHDSLTGLLNRGAFEAAARQRIESRDGRFAFALIDIDHFKRINDLYGHAAGDAALRVCAETCREQLRASDIIARVGGEEFAVILDDVSLNEAAAAIERIRSAVAAREIEIKDHQVKLTVSAGLYHADDSADTLDDIMRVVDEKLYEAKRGGRNRVVQATAA